VGISGDVKFNKAHIIRYPVLPERTQARPAL